MTTVHRASHAPVEGARPFLKWAGGKRRLLAQYAEHFPLPSAASTVPGGKSVACSTPEALEWDAAFKEMADPSGRAVRDVHQKAY